MANGNQSGFGTPGTQQTAQQNVQTGGVNPNMPVGQQLAKQGASSYQQSLTPGGASPGVNLAKAAYSAAPAQPPLVKPSPLAGFPYKESLGMNASLGFSNEMAGAMPGYVPGGGDLESTYGSMMPLKTPSQAKWDDRTEEEKAAYRAGHGGMTYPEAVTKKLKEKSELGQIQGADGSYGEVIEGEYDPNSAPPPTPGGAYYEYNEADQPGIDPDEYDKMQQANVDDAERMYQQGLQSLARQYAMMGMTGSGAHMVANNALGKQIHAQLIQAQNVLALENARIMEEDFAEKFDNAIRASETFTNNALKTGQIDQVEVATLAAEIGLINNELGQNVLNFMDELGYAVTATQASQFNHVVSTALAMDDPTAAAQWASEQFSNILSGTGVDGYEHPEGYDSDAPFTNIGQQNAIYDAYSKTFGNMAPGLSLADIQAYVVANNELPEEFFDAMYWGEDGDLAQMFPDGWDHSKMMGVYWSIVMAFGGNVDITGKSGQ